MGMRPEMLRVLDLGAQVRHVILSELFGVLILVLDFGVMLMILLSLMLGFTMCHQSLLFELLNKAFQVIILNGLKLHIISAENTSGVFKGRSIIWIQEDLSIFLESLLHYS